MEEAAFYVPQWGGGREHVTHKCTWKEWVANASDWPWVCFCKFTQICSGARGSENKQKQAWPGNKLQAWKSKSVIKSDIIDMSTFQSESKVSV